MHKFLNASVSVCVLNQGGSWIPCIYEVFACLLAYVPTKLIFDLLLTFKNVDN